MHPVKLEPGHGDWTSEYSTNVDSEFVQYAAVHARTSCSGETTTARENVKTTPLLKPRPF